MTVKSDDYTEHARATFFIMLGIIILELGILFQHVLIGIETCS